MPESKEPNELPAGRTPLYAANEKITHINVADEIKNSFLDYSMSVIISRALPDVRDGLKPSQRRILYAMEQLSLFPGRKHMKCAKICGDTSGNYHPHGEAVIYPTLVHMAQLWAMRERLVDGKGNFGSVEDDPPAAMRYTEARLTQLGAALMLDMDKDTVEFVPNYDERLTEPKVLPSAFPNLLVNGGTGIAVGMATNMPPHNLGEIIDGVCAHIDNLYKHTQLEVSFAVNCLAIDHGRPKTLNLKELIQCYIEHRREVVLRRTRFELKKAEERAEILEGYLCALLNLDEFIRIIRGSRNREEAKVKLLAFEWTRPQVERWGLLIRSDTRLVNGVYSLTERQVDAILELQLYRLTGLEIDKVKQEYTELLDKIKDLLDILAKEQRVMAIIKKELQEIKQKHATPRLSEIVPDEGEIAIEDLIANEGVIITITHAGLIKRTNVSSYRAQRRGGQGDIGMTSRGAQSEDDRVL